MFAKLTGKFQTISDSGFIFSHGWTDCTWVGTSRKATKLAKDQAERLINELNDKQPGAVYSVEQDEDGEANVPPQGLDNFVVRKG